MEGKHKEKYKMLEQQKQQLEANLFKVLGAMELLEAMEKEEAEANKPKSVGKENKSGTKKIKH